MLGIEARGFIVAAALGAHWNRGLLLARKSGKLPGKTFTESYDLEYGRAALETPADILRPGTRVLIADDVIATGGTAAAAHQLTKATGCTPIAFAFLVELDYLGGRARLESKSPVHSVIAYSGDGAARVAE